MPGLCSYARGLFHQMHPLTVWAYPSGAVAHAPLVFGKALRADGKAAGTRPTERHLFRAAMTSVAVDTSATTFSW
jgi:hypothetical protein